MIYNVLMKFIINNRIDVWKNNVNLLIYKLNIKIMKIINYEILI